MGSSWGRFGTHSGSQNRPLDLANHWPGATFFRSCDRLVPSWLQDRPKRAPGGVLGSSWGGLGPLLGALGSSWDSLGGLLGRLEGVLGRSWGLLGPLWMVFGVFGDVLRGLGLL